MKIDRTAVDIDRTAVRIDRTAVKIDRSAAEIDRSAAPHCALSGRTAVDRPAVRRER